MRDDPAALRSALLEHFERGRRPLPWRSERVARQKIAALLRNWLRGTPRRAYG